MERTRLEPFLAPVQADNGVRHHILCIFAEQHEVVRYLWGHGLFRGERQVGPGNDASPHTRSAIPQLWEASWQRSEPTKGDLVALARGQG